MSRGIVNPLRDLTDAARAFGSGNLRVRADVKGGGSIRELGDSFNRMAEQIEDREEKLRQLDDLKSEFVSSVSHELRTPLTTIKTLVRVLEKKDVTEEERSDFLKTIAVECDRQIDFIQNLLDLSRLESGTFRPSLREVNLAQFLEEFTNTQRRSAEPRGLEIELSVDKGTRPIATDPEALRRIMSSLLENAMKYTAEGGNVKIGAELRDPNVLISVDDSGCGIAPEDMPHVFERYYRGRPLPCDAGETEASRDSSTTDGSGIGLGLYIAQNLVDQLGGEVSVFSPSRSDGRGTRFEILLPASIEL
jgi:signal transduction histidine kinase